ncbi:unnamed protein product [Rhodiola kirilowii]
MTCNQDNECSSRRLMAYLDLGALDFIFILAGCQVVFSGQEHTAYAKESPSSDVNSSIRHYSHFERFLLLLTTTMAYCNSQPADSTYLVDTSAEHSL